MSNVEPQFLKASFNQNLYLKKSTYENHEKPRKSCMCPPLPSQGLALRDQINYHRLRELGIKDLTSSGPMQLSRAPSLLILAYRGDRCKLELECANPFLEDSKFLNHEKQ
jgi:hypothetical protein